MTFLTTVLLMEPEDINAEDIEMVRPVRGFRSGGREEMLVRFKDCDKRDLIYTFARNLESHADKNGKRTAGLKIDVPAHLKEVFRTLDTHGHLLKLKHKDLKRHVKFDDELLTLCLDVKIDRDSPWERVSAVFAREERKERELRKITKRKTRARKTSTLESSSGESSSDSDNGSPATGSNSTDLGPVNAGTRRPRNLGGAGTSK